MVIAAAIQAAGSIGGGMLANKGGQETRIQRRQRKLIDQLMESLGGSGPYADLYKFDQDSFNKSFVDPAKAMFRNQISPQIQQSYIASGQQRGTGLDDTLTRAGVDLDQMLNQYLMQYQEAGKNRMQNSMGMILGAGAGGTQGMSTGQAAAQAAGGYFSSDAFGNSLDKIASHYSKSTQPERQYSLESERPGYYRS